MIEAGIDYGDLVLIRQQNCAEPGDIVVALIDDEATLKRFTRKITEYVFIPKTAKWMISTWITVSFRASL